MVSETFSSIRGEWPGPFTIQIKKLPGGPRGPLHLGTGDTSDLLERFIAKSLTDTEKEWKVGACTAFAFIECRVDLFLRQIRRLRRAPADLAKLPVESSLAHSEEPGCLNRFAI